MLLSKQLLRSMRTSFKTCSCSDTLLVLWGKGKWTVIKVRWYDELLQTVLHKRYMHLYDPAIARSALLGIA